jgi:hypothetical protein
MYVPCIPGTVCSRALTTPPPFPVPKNRKRAHVSGRTGACHHRLPHTLNARGVRVDMPRRLLPHRRMQFKPKLHTPYSTLTYFFFLR